MLLETETYDFYVSFLVSMFHSKNTEGEKQKHCGSDSKTLWERFKNTEGARYRSHSVFVFLPQCFLNETLKLKMKHRNRMFQPSEVLIINKLKHKNET